jgi:hypothetical protein
VRDASIDRAHFSRHFDVHKSVLTTCSSIASSRKRKLRELFAVATDHDGIPDYDFSDADAPWTTPAEEKFLNESDILQYVTPSQNTELISLRRDRVAALMMFSNSPGLQGSATERA